MRKFVPLPRSFYAPSARLVAPRLLGHWLLRNTPQGPCGGPIVEVEAYLLNDAACHAAPGPTPRNRVMFGEPGHSYVYLIYGMHFCVNVVCQPAGIAEAVLIRAIEPEFGLDLLHARRKTAKTRELTNGPAKLCEAMDIALSLNGVDYCDADSPLFIGQNDRLRSFRRGRGPVIATTRIGITKAADLPLRYYLAGSEFVSHRVRQTDAS